MGCVASKEIPSIKPVLVPAGAVKNNANPLPAAGQTVAVPVSVPVVKPFAMRDEVTQPTESRAKRSYVPSSVWGGNKVQRVCFGAGCYWGTEKFFRGEFIRKYGHLGVITAAAAVGFMGPPGASEKPTYMEVCKGSSGHVEVFHVEYQGGMPFFEAMVRFFFQFHDPTTRNAQGNDRGSQYASVIYCETEEQKAVALRVKQDLQRLIQDRTITVFQEHTVETIVTGYTVFYPALEEHQNYLQKNPNGYCNHRIRFVDWPKFSVWKSSYRCVDDHSVSFSTTHALFVVVV
eukprot:scaffold1438_cov173-Ochromonas_danica.AAC.5